MTQMAACRLARPRRGPRLCASGSAAQRCPATLHKRSMWGPGAQLAWLSASAPQSGPAVLVVPLAPLKPAARRWRATRCCCRCSPAASWSFGCSRAARRTPRSSTSCARCRQAPAGLALWSVMRAGEAQRRHGGECSMACRALGSLALKVWRPTGASISRSAQSCLAGGTAWGVGLCRGGRLRRHWHASGVAADTKGGARAGGATGAGALAGWRLQRGPPRRRRGRARPAGARARVPRGRPCGGGRRRGWPGEPGATRA